MRVMITRPREDALVVAKELAAQGVETIVEPLFEIVPRVANDLDLDGAQALLLTSANGVRALAAASPRRVSPILAVGEATAAAARAAGFARVEAAGAAAGDVVALAALAEKRCDPRAGALVHVCGSVVAGDLAGRLAARGFTVRREVLYEARPAAALSGAAVTALSQGAVDAVLLFSPRTAKAFVRLAEEAGVRAALGLVEALCLSPAVGEAAGAVAWREVRVADRPNQAALLALVAR